MSLVSKRFSVISSICAMSISLGAYAQVPGVPSTGGNAPDPVVMMDTTIPQTATPKISGQVVHDVAPAQKLLSEGKYAQAEAMYREYLASNPADLVATNGLGLALAHQFKLDGASQLFERVLAQDPNNSAAYAGRATVVLNRLQSSSGLVRSEKESALKLAEQYANQACTFAPASAEAHYVLGNVLKEQGKLDDAASEYRNAINFDPRMSFAFSGLGSIELDKNGIAQAKAHFQEAIKLNSANSTAHYGLGAAFLKEGKLDDAIGELNTSLYQFPNSWPVRMALGRAYQLQGNSAAAIQQYQLSTLIKPENAEPYLRMAEVRQERGDIELAIADLHSGLTQAPYNLELRQSIADLHLRLDKADDAIKDYRSILQMNPRNPAALKGLSQALYLKAQKAASSAVFSSNDYDSAFKAIDEAIKINPNDMELLLAKGKLMTLTGQKPDLSKMKQPTNEAETVAYAAGLRVAGEYAQGAAMLKNVIDQQTDAKQAYALADIAVMIRDLNNAQAGYNKGVSLSGSPDRAKRGQAQIAQLQKAANDDLVVALELLKKKEFDGAAVKFRSALGDNPELADAHLGLAQALEKGNKQNSILLADSAHQYQCYLTLKGANLPQKDREKIANTSAKLNEKSLKLKEKEAKDNIQLSAD